MTDEPYNDDQVQSALPMLDPHFIDFAEEARKILLSKMEADSPSWPWVLGGDEHRMVVRFSWRVCLPAVGSKVFTCTIEAEDYNMALEKLRDEFAESIRAHHESFRKAQEAAQRKIQVAGSGPVRLTPQQAAALRRKGMKLRKVGPLSLDGT